MDDSIITRYMPLERAIEFITNGEMYLARYDSFEDKLEGHAAYQIARKFGLKWEKDVEKSYLKPEVRKKLLFASCWYNGGEDLAMWDRYRAERGLAIQVRKMYLKDDFVLSNNDKFTPIYESNKYLEKPVLSRTYSDEIKYLDDEYPNNNIEYQLGLIKHSAFKHENEYRFVLRQNGMPKKIKASAYIFKISNFQTLSVKVITNPYMDATFTEMITHYIDKLPDRSSVEVAESKYRNLF